MPALKKSLHKKALLLESTLPPLTEAQLEYLDRKIEERIYQLIAAHPSPWLTPAALARYTAAGAAQGKLDTPRARAAGLVLYLVTACALKHGRVTHADIMESTGPKADALFQKLDGRKMLLIRRIVVKLGRQGEFQKARQIVKQTPMNDTISERHTTNNNTTGETDIDQ